MEMLDPVMLVFILFFGFMAAFVDAIVGGGGLISIPALMATGIPPVFALGTNKMASVMGASMSFWTFFKSGKIDRWLIKRLFPLSFIGSALGVVMVRLVPSNILRPLVVVMLIIVLIYSILKKDWGKDSTYHGLTRRMLVLSMLVAFSLGFYDGFFGPGTGSFLLFAFLSLGFDFLGAAANARALNFASNFAAMIFFVSFGLVDFAYALPMGLAMIAGAWCGAHMALRRGTSFVRPLFIIMTTVLIGKQLLDLLR